MRRVRAAAGTGPPIDGGRTILSLVAYASRANRSPHRPTARPLPSLGDDRQQHSRHYRLDRRQHPRRRQGAVDPAGRATTLPTRSYAASEKAKVQALNDFLIFGTVALSSFASGALLTGFGWGMVQLALLPFVAVAASAILWLKLRAWRAAPQYAGR